MQYYMFVHYILQRGKDTNMFTDKLKKIVYAACCRRVHNSFLCISFMRNCVSAQLQFDQFYSSMYYNYWQYYCICMVHFTCNIIMVLSVILIY